MAPRHGTVETSANHSTLDFVLAKRRLGKSIMAQNVGITGTISIVINIIKFNWLTAIQQLHVVQCIHELFTAGHAMTGSKLFHSAGIYKLSRLRPQVRNHSWDRYVGGR